MDTNFSDFKKKLAAEGNFGPSSELIDRLLDMAEEVSLKPREVLIGYGSCDTNLYIVKEGIIQILYFDGEKEVTLGFGFPGTFFCSPQSFYNRQPAVMQVESCKIPSALLKISKSNFTNLMEESHEFARWMFNIAMGQIYTSELKAVLIKGSAEDRYRNLLKHRPDIAQSISSSSLSSYLRITPSWLFKIKKKLLYE